MDRQQLNALRSKRLTGEPEDESIHFYICKSCGQAVDKRRLGDVVHHEEPDHEPLSTD